MNSTTVTMNCRNYYGDVENDSIKGVMRPYVFVKSVANEPISAVSSFIFKAPIVCYFDVCNFKKICFPSKKEWKLLYC